MKNSLSRENVTQKNKQTNKGTPNNQPNKITGERKPINGDVMDDNI